MEKGIVNQKIIQMEPIIPHKLLKELVAFRKMLHANPEVSGKEYNTAKRVAEFLKTCMPTKIIENIGGTGIVAVFDSGKLGKLVMFRAELDALPIQETNTFKHASTIAGVSHKCGHDGHTTVLLGLARILSEQKPKTGKIFLLFQPAEEDGEGAKAVFADPKLKRFVSTLMKCIVYLNIKLLLLF